MFRILTFALSILVYHSIASSTTELCPPCPSGITNVAITFASVPRQYTDVEWEQNLQHATWDFWKKPREPKDEGIVKIRATKEIREKLLALAGQCKRVKFMGIYSHGDTGILGFKDDYLNRSNLNAVFGGLDCIMAKDATVSIFGCHVARECHGQFFVGNLAKILLKKSGKLTAPTSYSQQYPLAPPFTFNFSPEEIHVNDRGQIDSITNRNTVRQCLVTKRAEVDALINKMKFCRMDTKIGKLTERSERLKVLQSSWSRNQDSLITDLESQNPIVDELELASSEISIDSKVKFLVDCLSKKLDSPIPPTK